MSACVTRLLEAVHSAVQLVASWCGVAVEPVKTRLQLVERERAVRCGQLLYSRQRHQRGVHGVSCGDVQREQRVDCVERVLGVPCGGVLPCGLQLVERERAV